MIIYKSPKIDKKNIYFLSTSSW